MTLGDVLALHPGDEADTAALSAALETAEAKRRELLAQAGAAERVRAGDILTTDDKAMAAAEKTAATARFAAERIGALLPRIRTGLVAARGREELAELRAEADQVNALMEAVVLWNDESLPRVLEMARAGVQAERQAVAAYVAYLAKVDGAFQSQAVRDAAPDGLGVALVTIPENRPSANFLFWSL